MYNKKINAGLDGYTMVYYVTYEHALRYMPNASAGVRKLCDGRTILTSYYTDVCEIDGEGWLTVYGLYSATTRRHIGAFLKEYANGASYDIAKRCYYDGLRYNVNTGEVKAL